MDSAEIQTLTPKQIIWAGRSRFTIQNEETNNRFTFQVNAPKYDKEGNKISPEQADIRFVKVRVGANYEFVGILTPDNQFKFSKKSKLMESETSVKAIRWLAGKVDSLPDKVKFYHEGCCLRCGRALTVPESILSGIGPECAKKVAQ